MTDPATDRLTLDRLFDELWNDYAGLAPQAARIRGLLEERGERVVNDHIAFRTFDREPICLERLEIHLLGLGYRRYSPYEFAGKRLEAFGYVHPEPERPRVFLSQLQTRYFDDFLQSTVAQLCSQVDPVRVQDPSVLWSGRLWSALPIDSYRRLAEQSEYAGWVAALGLRANHFTISVNALRDPSLSGLLDLLEGQGYRMNTSGGRIKGSPEVLLEQASTLADEAEVEFADGRLRIPTCYYEFARRYPEADGQLYQGFVAASADRIFESTNRRPGNL